MLKANLKHMMRCLDRARAEGATRLEVRRGAHERYMHRMWQRADGTIFKSGACRSANSYYVDRHGDASLPLPATPWWRVLRSLANPARDYDFG